MSKNYEAGPKPVSPYSEAKEKAYLNAGNTVQVCSHGASGGEGGILKDMANNAVKKKR